MYINADLSFIENNKPFIHYPIYLSISLFSNFSLTTYHVLEDVLDAGDLTPTLC